MNRLEDYDMVKPRDYEEYLNIHRLFELHGIKLLNSYQRRLEMGRGNYEAYPCLYWDGDESSLTGCRGEVGAFGHRYRELSLEEFLTKAGIGSKIKYKYKTGIIKHMFV